MQAALLERLSRTTRAAHRTHTSTFDGTLEGRQRGEIVTLMQCGAMHCCADGDGVAVLVQSTRSVILSVPVHVLRTTAA
jgi:hypothetical protein